MNPALKGIWERMLNLGLGALAHANRHAAYMAMENNTWSDLSVLQAAHAAELIIKARIAQEHPLLIFDRLPHSAKTIGTYLDLEDLFKDGRTIQWSDLPERLWATTGQQIPNKDRFVKFGRLRNSIQHFAPPVNINTDDESLRFVFEVIDPFIFENWGLYAVDYDEDTEEYIYFIDALVSRNILFLVSTEAASCFNEWDVDWSKVDSQYRKEIEKRVAIALNK